jgi:hypothetical protein
VKKKGESGLDFLIDQLTNSIQNVVTGDSFATDVAVLARNDLKSISKASGWLFDWKSEFKNPIREVFKLSIVHNPTIIQGLISLELKKDHVFLHLVESAPFNNGKSKMYTGVPGNLVAFACKLSFQRGFEGNISFLSKSQLIDHYEKSLGAVHIGGRVMIIESKTALILMDKYFQNQ